MEGRLRIRDCASRRLAVYLSGISTLERGNSVAQLVISFVLVISVIYTTSPWVYFHRGAPNLSGNPRSLTPYFTAA